jgi:hypothetical protein
MQRLYDVLSVLKKQNADDADQPDFPDLIIFIRVIRHICVLFSSATMFLAVCLTASNFRQTLLLAQSLLKNGRFNDAAPINPKS